MRYGGWATGLSWCLCALMVSAVGAKDPPFSRAKRHLGTTNQVIADASTAAAAAVNNGAGALLTGSFQAKAAMFRNLMKRGNVDPFDVVDAAVGSKGFKTILENTEVQHRIMEGLPLLAAFDGFREIMDRQAGPKETAKGFAKGMETLIGFSKDAHTKVKDPTLVMDTIKDMVLSGDQGVQTLLRSAQAGDKASVTELQRRVQKAMFPGVDLDVLERVGRKQQSFDTIKSNSDVMRFLDADPHLSRIFRGGLFEQAAAMVADGLAQKNSVTTVSSPSATATVPAN